MTNGKRDYKKENRLYDSKPEVKHKRAERNKARRIMMREGRVHKGDGKDVDHRIPLSRGGTTVRTNLRVQTAHNNRSYPRNKDSTIKRT